MQLARVKGTVVSTNKAEKLNGLKLQLIKPIDIETWQEKGGLLVAIDLPSESGSGPEQKPGWRARRP